MSDILSKIARLARSAVHAVWANKIHALPVALILVWSTPYFTTGQKLELGDFSFFSQAYEAMRISIMEYGQFPWFNPWVSGGVPLYANPQMGVFSVQMLLTLAMGAPIALKLSLVLYTLAGYASMYILLRRYFKIAVILSVALSLLWIFGSFFVSHLPAHFTFAWYMIAPLFVYLALTAKGWRGGLLFGGAFAVMALSQIHNPFMHIALVCGLILVGRFIFEKASRRALLIAGATAAAVFLLLAGHRFVMTYENVQDFPRDIVDTTPHPLAALSGAILPMSKAYPLQFIHYPPHPYVPHGFHEASATIGMFALIAALLCVLFVAYQVYLGRQKLKATLKAWRLPLVVLGLAILCLLAAMGSFAPFAPYSLIKLLPGFSDMRVSTRWLLWFDLALLVFMGLVIQRLAKQSFVRFATATLVLLGVLELFILNAGYQRTILTEEPAISTKNTSQQTFEQTAYFGQTRKLPDGGELPAIGKLPAHYREFEAMTFNLGVLYANDALVQLHLDPRRDPGHPTCAWEEGCNFVRSGNARVAFWSPNKIVLERTAPGSIQLNMNNSRYFEVNGSRNNDINVAEPFTDFVINARDDQKTITIEARPSFISSIQNILGGKGK